MRRLALQLGCFIFFISIFWEPIGKPKCSFSSSFTSYPSFFSCQFSGVESSGTDRALWRTVERMFSCETLRSMTICDHVSVTFFVEKLPSFSGSCFVVSKSRDDLVSSLASAVLIGPHVSVPAELKMCIDLNYYKFMTVPKQRSILVTTVQEAGQPGMDQNSIS